MRLWRLKALYELAEVGSMEVYEYDQWLVYYILVFWCIIHEEYSPSGETFP